MAARARRPAKPKTPKKPAPPRRDDYEALAAPLREFARVSPALVEALAALPRLSAVLAQSAERLDRVSERLEGASRAETPRPNGAAAPLHEVAAELDEVKRGLLTALGTLPREDDYRPAARQLREVASVSPSLMEWLKEVPKLTAPLADAVTILRETSERVTAARASLAKAIEEIEGR